MKILVIGSGGREHTLVWKIGKSSLVKQIFCAPGNAGTNRLPKCENVNIKPTELDKLLAFALFKEIDLTVVGPEDPLVMGIVDLFTANGLAIVGPSQRAAELEGSKIFSKEFMLRHNIPTAEYLGDFDSCLRALAFVDGVKFPIVAKADGLAAGKGVKVCHTITEAREFIDEAMAGRKFGMAGAKILFEEFLDGEEASLLYFSDGENILPMASSQDHKPVNDNDEGLNTGGMGAYSPAPVVTPKIAEQVMRDITVPTIRGMAQEGRPYRGILYVGVMIKDGQAKVLEFNARFGDPETQVILPRLKNDIVPVLMRVATGTLKGLTLDWDPRPAVCVVMTSGGYPGPYTKGHVITGLEQAEQMGDVIITHAGTALKDGKIVTNGGRVLGVTAMDRDMLMTILAAYNAVELINWEGAHYRQDIGRKALKYLKI
ncbi:MAG: phosphoribosylamine--glycine ligase [bacterium]|nr:phosphoribosylamine--glycine ligase [bacterium]